VSDAVYRKYPLQKGTNMAVRAGVALPGPFFISFPTGGPIIGSVGVMLLPMALLYWFMKVTLWFMVAMALVLARAAVVAFLITTRYVIPWIHTTARPWTRRTIGAVRYYTRKALAS